MKTKLKYIFKISLSLFLISSFVIFPSEITEAARVGLMLWFKNVLPVILPFIIVIKICGFLGIEELINRIFFKPMKYIFNVSGYAAFPFIMGMLSGNPMGAKITSDLYRDKKISAYEAQKILSFSSNTGIAFVVGSIGTNMLKSRDIGIILFMIMIFSSVITGMLFRFYKYKAINIYYKAHSRNTISFYDMINDAVRSAADTVTVIGVYIIFFSVFAEICELIHIFDIIAAILLRLPFFDVNINIIKGFLKGILEITNGAFLLSKENIRDSLPFIAFVTGFGGLSIFFQSLSFIRESPLSPFLLFLSKFINGILSFSACHMIILLKII